MEREPLAKGLTAAGLLPNKFSVVVVGLIDAKGLAGLLVLPLIGAEFPNILLTGSFDVPT